MRLSLPRIAIAGPIVQQLGQAFKDAEERKAQDLKLALALRQMLRQDEQFGLEKKKFGVAQEAHELDVTEKKRKAGEAAAEQEGTRSILEILARPRTMTMQEERPPPPDAIGFPGATSMPTLPEPQITTREIPRTTTSREAVRDFLKMGKGTLPKPFLEKVYGEDEQARSLDLETKLLGLQKTTAELREFLRNAPVTAETKDLEAQLKRLEVLKQQLAQEIQSKVLAGTATATEEQIGGVRAKTPAPPQAPAIPSEEGRRRAKAKFGLTPTPEQIAQATFEAEKELRESGAIKLPSAEERGQQVQRTVARGLAEEIQGILKQDASFVGGPLGVLGRAGRTLQALNLAPETFSKLDAKLKQLRAQLTRAMAGANIGPAERELYFASLPDVKQSTQQFVANLQATIENIDALDAASASVQQKSGLGTTTGGTPKGDPLKIR